MSASRIFIVTLAVACTSGDADAPEISSSRTMRTDTVVAATIPPAGGSVELAGVVTVSFPSGAFDIPREVTVSTTSEPSTEAGRTRWDVSVGPPPPMRYDIHIDFGSSVPAKGFEVVVSVPDSYVRGFLPERSPWLFARVVSGGGMEDLDLFEPVTDSRFYPDRGVVRATISPDLVRPPGPDGRVSAILLIGAIGG